jgi:hypothetical protein
MSVVVAVMQEIAGGFSLSLNEPVTMIIFGAALIAAASALRRAGC